jgi:hypothetical protein
MGQNVHPPASWQAAASSQPGSSTHRHIFAKDTMGHPLLMHWLVVQSITEGDAPHSW